MLTKGIITSIDYSSNTCVVRIPIFEGAGNRTKIQAEAAICIPPGNYNGYRVNDVVVVGFGENSIDQPIILGKLYLGIQEEQSAGFRGALKIDHLTTNSITIPDDATINNKKLSNILKEISSKSDSQLTSEIYSTGEKEIGTWIDGKKLYRKTLEITDTVADKKNFSISKTLDSTYDTIMIDQSATFQVAEKAISPIFSDQVNANFWQCLINTSSSIPVLEISGYNKFGAISKHLITIKYTKK